MQTLTVRFVYQQLEYSAYVYKIAPAKNDTAQFHVMTIDPIIPSLPLPIFFIYNAEKGTFDYPVFPDHPDFTDILYDAIKTFCFQHEMPMLI